MPRGTRDTRPSLFPFIYRSVTFYGPAFQHGSIRFQGFAPGPYNPGPALRQARFGLFPFRSPLLRKSIFLSLPSGTEMVHFPEFASRPYEFRSG